jgi:hypothetical protein
MEPAEIAHYLIEQTINRVEEYNKMREQMGVAENESLLNDLKAQLEEQYATRRTRTQTAEGGQVSMGVIAGRVGEIERQENERIDAIGRPFEFKVAYGTPVKDKDHHHHYHKKL